jgi:hypothetical protein
MEHLQYYLVKQLLNIWYLLVAVVVLVITLVVLEAAAVLAVC